MLKLLFAFLLFWVIESASAQTYLIPHFDFVNLRIRGGSMVDKWYLGSRGEWNSGSGIGVDIRHHFKKFYLHFATQFFETNNPMQKL